MFIVLERGNVGLSYGVSLILDGAGNRKLLRVEVDNFGCFWVLIAHVSFSYLLVHWVAFSFMLSYVLVVYSSLYFRF